MGITVRSVFVASMILMCGSLYWLRLSHKVHKEGPTRVYVNFGVAEVGFNVYPR